MSGEDQALEVINTWISQDGAVNLVSIVPDGAVRGKTFTDPAKAKAWVTKQNATANVYFSVHGAPDVEGKPHKDDLRSLRRTHADCDLDKLPANHPLAALPLDERKAEARKAIEAMGGATVIIDTGGGLQPIRTLDAALPATAENVELVESMSRWMALNLPGGEAHCSNVDRLLRLPGTTNHPDARKRARGRVPVEARLLSVTDKTFPQSAFGQEKSKAIKTGTLDVSLIEEPPSIDELCARYSLDERTRAIIVDGRAPNETKPDDDTRDKWMFDGACQMVRAGVPAGLIAGVLLESEWEISGHVLSHRGRPVEEYAMRQAQRAIKAVSDATEAEKAELLAEPVPEQIIEIEAASSPPVTDIKGWLASKFVQIGQRDMTTIPKTRWILVGVVLAGEVSLFGGRGGVGKSLLAWLVAIMIATGLTFCWWPAPKKRRVLVISGEDTVDEIEKRVAAACAVHNIKRSALGDRFNVMDDRDIKLARLDTKTGAITRTELWANLKEAIRTEDIGLVIVDPVIKSSMGFDESNNADMNAFFEALRDLVTGQDAGVLVVDHFNKAGGGGDQASVRGASSKIDASRMAGTVSAMTEKEERDLKPPLPRESYVLFHDAKQNYAKKSGGRWFELVSHDVGNGEERPALVWRPFDRMGAVYDPQNWEHRSAFLILVDSGRDGTRDTGKPWRATTKGPLDGRLDDAVKDRFKLDGKQAQRWIDAFAKEGSIEQFEWTDEKGNKRRCWRVVRDYQTEEDSETMALRSLSH